MPTEPPNALRTIFAWLLILNGVIGLGFSVALVSQSGAGAAAFAAMFPAAGIASGIVSLRGRPVGLLFGTLFYLAQTIKYYSPAFSFGLASGLQAGISFHPVDGETLVVNVGAIVGTIYGLVVLNDAWYKQEAEAARDAGSSA
jgi:hypothetical protein